MDKGYPRLKKIGLLIEIKKPTFSGWFLFLGGKREFT